MIRWIEKNININKKIVFFTASFLHLSLPFLLIILFFKFVKKSAVDLRQGFVFNMIIYDRLIAT